MTNQSNTGDWQDSTSLRPTQLPNPDVLVSEWYLTNNEASFVPYSARVLTEGACFVCGAEHEDTVAICEFCKQTILAMRKQLMKRMIEEIRDPSSGTDS
jgi:hypothetical protein